MSAPYPTPTSAQYEVALEMIRAVNAKDFDKLGTHLDDSCTWLIHPSSISGGSNQRTTKDVFLDRGKQFMEGWLKESAVDVDHPVNVVEGKNVIVLQLTSNGRLLNGNEFKQEYLHIIRFNDDNKVVLWDEWLDSAYAMKAFAGGVPPIPGPDGRITNVEEAKRAHTGA